MIPILEPDEQPVRPMSGLEETLLPMPAGSLQGDAPADNGELVPAPDWYRAILRASAAGVPFSPRLVLHAIDAWTSAALAARRLGG